MKKFIRSGQQSDSSDVFVYDGTRRAPTDMVKVVVADGVPRIGDEAFAGCKDLTSITIPDSVTSIGDGAFQFCESLTSITIPSSVTSIGDAVFYSCKSLTSITILGSVTSIGHAAFRRCGSLTSITIPEGVTSIGDGAFYFCESLTSITIPEGVTSIGDGAFRRCESLTSIEIPESVKLIKSYAFKDCVNLSFVKLSEDCRLGERVFTGCSNLRNITKTRGEVLTQKVKKPKKKNVVREMQEYLDGDPIDYLAYDSPYADYIDGLFQQAVERLQNENQGLEILLEPSIQNGHGSDYLITSRGNTSWSYERECEFVEDLINSSNTEKELQDGIYNFLKDKLAEVEPIEDDDGNLVTL